MFRGTKVNLDLGSDSEDDGPQKFNVLPGAFVSDVMERKPAAPKPPSAPVLKNKSGFPGHQKRNIVSRFKQQKVDDRGQQQQPPAAVSVQNDSQPSGKSKSWEEEEKERIDRENKQKIAEMTTEEIEEERRELMNQFSPALLQRLLARGNVASGSEESDLSQMPGEIRELPPTAPLPAADAVQVEVPEIKERTKSAKSVAFADEPEFEEVNEAEEDAADQHEEVLPHDSVHFPQPEQPPSLDPSSETFLEDLHQKYFPSLPADPDKLEWMQPSSAKNTYDPAATALNASDVRFSFRGELIPPSKANEIPVTLGLHHHGDAPEAAGYTIAELAHLARSSYPAQRCIAFQTLGRILYKLSKGEFGDPGEPEHLLAGDVVEGPEDTFGELARGLWREVERLQIVQILVDEGEGRGVDGGRHVSAKAYATEAVWLWRKGGGRRWDAK
ncbi:Putative RNA polymerase II-associated protein RPAP1/Rba50 [Septoria linicola]|uniref:RNA polymerase II-associated protein RPAP1/Rba50 n=1 Tax=Septoria linicola TaxID=215465 RepID=A0A9Q9BAN8_9PEZI|nr:putative RNA polymerase II-associated protein RPAP1/Rba50 [Septoria linicola]USW59456.1 Putative RNA polymerase II-associated protein RPAP1/Rba50 [Septoria linicola]